MHVWVGLSKRMHDLPAKQRFITLIRQDFLLPSPQSLHPTNQASGMQAAK